MGVVAKAVSHFEEKLVGQESPASTILRKVSETDPVSRTVEQEFIAPIDKLLLGTNLEELNKPIVLPEVKAEFQSRENPAILKTVGMTEDLSEEELEEQDILGKSKRNRLRVPLTGGVSTTSAGVASPAAPGTGTGLKI